MNLHEELHRVILRIRWLRWINRVVNTRRRYRCSSKRVQRLSERLSNWRPIWNERQDDEPEMK